MNTIHRRDINSSELTLIAQFVGALATLHGINGHLPWDLGIFPMLLPVWYKDRSGWNLSHYKTYKREALGFEVHDFRRISRYLQVKEAEMIRVLFKMSMLAVVDGQSVLDRPRFKMEFRGAPIDWAGVMPWSVSFGFVIERRRAEGGIG